VSGAVALALVLVVWLGAGFKSVPEGAIGLLQSSVRSDRALDAGRHLTFPGLEQLKVLDPYSRQATVEWSSPEGTSLAVRFDATIRLTLDGASELLRRGEGIEPLDRLNDAIDGIVVEAVDAAPREGALPELEPAAKGSLKERLAEYGHVENALLLAYVEDSPVMLALRQEQAREKIRSLAQQTNVRTLIVGLDGADWQIAEPLIEQGRLPILASLRLRGAHANLKTLLPILSPLIWTSVATGVTPDRHGVLDFLVQDPHSGQKVPVNSRYRKVRALWNIFTEADRTVDFVAWWASWPAEQINGHMISDRVSYSLFDLDLPADGTATTYPPDYIDQVRDRLIDDAAITYEEVARFADVTREEFLAERTMIEQDRSAAYERPLNHLTKILAATRNYHTINLDLLGRGQSDLTAVYYQGIDEVGHRFMHFAPPRLPSVTEEDHRRYGRVVEEFYVYQDELLGELLRAAASDTTVIVLSDHGFVNGPDRPQDQTADIEGQPSHWHRPYGMLILAGPPIVPGELDTVSVLDIAPTVLRLAGLPLAEDLDGRVVEEAIRPEFLERYPRSTLVTYESTPMRTDAVPMSEAMAAVESEVMENLRALGYVGGDAGSSTPGSAASSHDDEAEALSATVSSHVNLAGVYLVGGELDKAEVEIQSALELAPTSVSARRHLFSLREQQGRLDEAIDVASQLIADGETRDSQFLGRVAGAYEGAGRIEEGIRFFRAASQQGLWELRAPLSRLLLTMDDLAGAEREAHAVLDQDPVNEVAMATLVGVARTTGNPGSVQPLLEAALAVNPRSVMHLNWLAVVLEGNGEGAAAEDALVHAMEIDPDHGATLANLGSLYGRHGRAAEAVPLLERALQVEPDNLEARVNLGTALARLDRKAEAMAELEEAYDRGLRIPAICNTLARTYGESGDLDSAAQWLRRSLEIDPNQPMIQQFLQSLENR
jgi:predicted AlkP superfamily phosphohydrolase/phosphomutase/tetratricopeptide (TPR) repeat protein